MRYRSVLWPDFDFKAIADTDGRLESAAYRRARGRFPDAVCPSELSMWSVDISEFAHRYDSLPLGYRWPLFDDLLPAYEEHEFDWQG